MIVKRKDAALIKLLSPRRGWNKTLRSATDCLDASCIIPPGPNSPTHKGCSTSCLGYEGCKPCRAETAPANHHSIQESSGAPCAALPTASSRILGWQNCPWSKAHISLPGPSCETASSSLSPRWWQSQQPLCSPGSPWCILLQQQRLMCLLCAG